MSIKINSTSTKPVPPFAIGSIDGVEHVITASGKYPVKVSRDGDELTISDAH